MQSKKGIRNKMNINLYLGFKRIFFIISCAFSIGMFLFCLYIQYGYEINWPTTLGFTFLGYIFPYLILNIIYFILDELIRYIIDGFKESKKDVDKEHQPLLTK